MARFMTHAERAVAREAIKNFATMHNRAESALIRGNPLDTDQFEYLKHITGTVELSGQVQALNHFHNTLEQAYHAKLREMAPDDLTAFSEYLNPDEPPAPHHVFFCNALQDMEERKVMRMLLSAPPGHAKSQYASRYFPTWYLGRHPKHKFMQAGHTQTFVENEFGKKCRGIIESERYGHIFPDVHLSTDSKAAGYWTITTGGSWIGKGIGQGIAGFRANMAGVDDPFASRESAESEIDRNKVWDWFSADFTTRLLPNSPMYAIMTRWHNDDLGGRIEQMNKDHKGLPWKIINLPAIAEAPIVNGVPTDPMGRAPGEALWPTFYTTTYLNNLKDTLPARDWNSLYRGTPVDEHGGVFKSDYLFRYKELPNPERIRRTTISVDCANKDTQRSDYTVISVWIEDDSRCHYLASIIRARMEFPLMVKTINSAAQLNLADVILVEDKGSGTQYIQLQSDPETANAPCSVVSISTNNDSKAFRFDGCIPMWQQGRVRIPERAGWLAEYESELLGFPGSKYDDQVDSTSQYLNWVKPVQSLGSRKLDNRGRGNASAVREEILAAIEAKKRPVTNYIGRPQAKLQ